MKYLEFIIRFIQLNYLCNMRDVGLQFVRVCCQSARVVISIFTLSSQSLRTSGQISV